LPGSRLSLSAGTRTDETEGTSVTTLDEADKKARLERAREAGLFRYSLVQELAEAGITANVVPVDGARQLADGHNKALEMTTYNWSGRPDPDGNTYQFFHTTPGVSLNWAGVSNPELDKLLEQTRTVSDHTERKKLYSQIIQILRDETPALFVVHPIEPKALSPKLQGYIPVPDGMLRFKDVWLK